MSLPKPTWIAWFDKAAEDLKVARFIVQQSKIDEGFRGPLVFHSQQAAEKALKGYLAFNKQRFDKTHILGNLLKGVENVDSNFAKDLRPAEILTDYAIAYRYPEEGNVKVPLTNEVAENALKLAVWVYEETKNRVDQF